MTEPETTLAATEVTPMAMVQQAISSGASIDVMERLLDLQERWQANEARRAFSAALAALRDDLPQIVKTQQVDFTTGRFWS